MQARHRCAVLHVHQDVVRIGRHREPLAHGFHHLLLLDFNLLHAAFLPGLVVADGKGNCLPHNHVVFAILVVLIQCVEGSFCDNPGVLQVVADGVVQPEIHHEALLVDTGLGRGEIGLALHHLDLRVVLGNQLLDLGY